MRSKSLLLAAVVAMAAPAFAQSPGDTPLRVRGVIEKQEGQTILVKSRDGQELTITLTADVAVNGIAARRLDDIKQGDFVGVAAVKGGDARLHAQEVLILPEAARGSNEGHFPWDLTPDSTMTNATVAEVTAAPQGRMLKLKHKGGENDIEVGPEAPVVTFVPGDPSLLKPGATIFIFAALKKPDGSIAASRISVEKDGVKPPM